ncbi:MAG: dTDP-4-dehydrorhamnose 3,5-epimerase family protein [Agromyces sp.]
MEIRELGIAGAFEITPKQFPDDRGVFLEWFRREQLETALGRPFPIAQANTSVSRQGTVRGIHFADVPPSQAKYVTAMDGAVLDFIVDIRVGSPSFGEWEAVQLDAESRRAVFVSEGLGHCFVALTESATVSYLVSAPFAAEREHGITPLDPQLNLPLGLPREALLLSPKDLAAPTLAEAEAAGLLPSWTAAEAFIRSLREGAS